MGKTLPVAGPRRPPKVASGALQGREPTPDERTESATAQRYIARGYEIARAAVREWGGSASLASWWGCAESNLSARLNRAEVNGSLSYAFLDFLMVACTKPQAAEQVLFDLCDLFGFEHPKRRRTKTDAEKLVALVNDLRRAGPLGEAAIRQTALAMGADPAEFDL